MEDNNGGFQSPQPGSDEGQQELDRVVHEPSRLRILAAVNRREEADFKYLETITKLQKSNLSIQTSKLEAAGFITVHKSFEGKYPVTNYRITPLGRAALENYKKRINALIEDEQGQLADLQREKKESKQIN
jgi:DNA-binding MarR family transcriptional regulator